LFCEEGAPTAAAAGPFEFVSEKLEMGFVGIIMMMVMGRKKKMMMGWREMVVCVSIILFLVQQADAHGGAHHEEVAGPAAHDDASSVGLDNLQAKGLILVKICCLIIAFFAARH
jgi:hypothetical protein